jgi:hypothetical protein
MNKENTQINKIRNEKGELTKTPRNSTESLGTTLRTYIQRNWKNFQLEGKFKWTSF